MEQVGQISFSFQFILQEMLAFHIPGDYKQAILGYDRNEKATKLKLLNNRPIKVGQCEQSGALFLMAQGGFLNYMGINTDNGFSAKAEMRLSH